MKAKRIKMSVSAVSAGVLAFALSSSAAVRTLPTPPPSDFIDTEASTNVVFAPLQEDTRQYVMRFAGDFSPSNDLEVAFGGDTNGDGDLSPEETEYRAGVDCGERNTPPLHLTRNQQSSWNLIKVTRRGFFSTEPSVTLKPRKPGLSIIVK